LNPKFGPTPQSMTVSPPNIPNTPTSSRRRVPVTGCRRRTVSCLECAMDLGETRRG
jgi:hypothetical protein